MKFQTIIENVQNGTFNFEGFKSFLKGLTGAFRTWLESLSFWGSIESVVNTIESYDMYILMAFGLVLVLFGKKILPVVKFAGLFLIGFGAGVEYLAPLVTFIPEWVIGLVIGLVAALLCKIFYYVLVIAGVGSIAYSAFFGGQLGIEAIDGIFKGNTVFSLIPAAVAILLVVLLLKWFEMLATAAYGAWMVAFNLHTVFPYLELDFVANIQEYVFLGLIALIALIGFIVQVKTRKRY